MVAFYRVIVYNLTVVKNLFNHLTRINEQVAAQQICLQFVGKRTRK